MYLYAHHNTYICSCLVSLIFPILSPGSPDQFQPYSHTLRAQKNIRKYLLSLVAKMHVTNVTFGEKYNEARQLYLKNDMKAGGRKNFSKNTYKCHYAIVTVDEISFSYIFFYFLF